MDHSPPRHKPFAELAAPTVPAVPKGKAALRAGLLWSIAEVERETALGKDTLRVWEKRYGFPQPLRDLHGERAYPDAQVQRLRLIKRLLDAGHRPGKVVPLDDAQLAGLLPSQAAARGLAASSPWPDTDYKEPPADAEPWLDWLAHNESERIKQALHSRILRVGLGHAVEHCVGPLCAQVGDAWLRGALSVYQEHLFTEIVQAVLREAMGSLDARTQGLQRPPRVLLTTTPNEQHGLGLLMAECFLALESCQRLNLGPATPLADMVLAVQQLHIDVLALSFSAHANRREVHESLRQLAAQLPAAVHVWVGGRGVALHQRGLPARVTAVTSLSALGVEVQNWRRLHPPAA